jgi:hypothetical protein
MSFSSPQRRLSPRSPALELTPGPGLAGREPGRRRPEGGRVEPEGAAVRKATVGPAEVRLTRAWAHRAPALVDAIATHPPRAKSWTPDPMPGVDPGAGRPGHLNGGRSCHFAGTGGSGSARRSGRQSPGGSSGELCRNAGLSTTAYASVLGGSSCRSGLREQTRARSLA